MNTLDSLLDLLPPPWTQDPASVVTALLNVAALELEAGVEDVDRLRRSHGFDTAYRLGDLAKLVALLGVTPLPWEDDLELLRSRARALIDARLEGSVGKREIGRFVVDYLARADEAVDVEVVRGLPPLRAWADAYPANTFEPGHEGVDDIGVGDIEDADKSPLGFVEWPRRRRRSTQLGTVPYLHRWTERNGGVFPSVPTLEITGLPGGRTAVPIVANLTTGSLIGYRGVLGGGRRLVIRHDEDRVIAELNDEVSGVRDVTDRLFSAVRTGSGLGELDPAPRLFTLNQGDNDLRYLNAGLYDVAGIDRVGFALAPDDLREGIFDETTFDHSLFPAGPVAALAMSWTERLPATFRVEVRRDVVVHRRGADRQIVGEVVATLRRSLGELRAAGVTAELEPHGLHDRQRQHARVSMSWVRLPAERGPAGCDGRFAVGARFGGSPLGDSRYS